MREFTNSRGRPLYRLPMTSLVFGPQGAANQTFSEASLSLSFQPHTHTRTCHTGMTSSTATFLGVTLLPPSRSKSPPHLSHFNTLSALSPSPCCHAHVGLLLSGHRRSFQQGDERTCRLSLSTASWFQQSVSILRPLEAASNHHRAEDYGERPLTCKWLGPKSSIGDLKRAGFSRRFSLRAIERRHVLCGPTVEGKRENDNLVNVIFIQSTGPKLSRRTLLHLPNPLRITKSFQAT